MNEELLKRALTGTVAKRYSEYGENDIKHTFSIGYRLKINMLIRKVRHGNISKTTRIIPVLRPNIILIAIFIAILTASAFMIWYHINGFSFKVEPTNSTVYVEFMDNPKTTIEEIYYIPDSVGVELVKQTIATGAVLSKYKLGDNQIILDQTLVIDKQQINTEGYLIEPVRIGENNGYFIQMDDSSFVSWSMNGYIFSITSDLDKEAVLNLAKMTIC